MYKYKIAAIFFFALIHRTEVQAENQQMLETTSVVHAKQEDPTKNVSSEIQKSNNTLVAPNASGDNTELKDKINKIEPGANDKNKFLIQNKLNDVDFRKVELINYPPIVLISEQEQRLNQLSNIKNHAEIKKLFKELCIEYAIAYNKQIAKLNFKLSSEQYKYVCDTYVVGFDELQTELIGSNIEVIFKKLVRNFDNITTKNYFTVTGTNTTILNSYDLSPLGRIGLPINFYYVLEQVALCIFLIIFVYLVYKKIKE